MHEQHSTDLYCGSKSPALLSQAKQLRPQMSEVYQVEGELQQIINEFEDSIVSLDKAIALDGTNAIAYVIPLPPAPRTCRSSRRAQYPAPKFAGAATEVVDMCVTLLVPCLADTSTRVWPFTKRPWTCRMP